MPRLVKSVRLQQKTNYRSDLYGKTRTRKGSNFIDPFPWVHGTLPEKIVYAELSRRHIPFLFLNDIKLSFPEIDLVKEFQADFIIPSLKIIIEVQGAFWHSKPKTVEADAIKLAYYELAGYTALAWWDYDIMSQLHELFAAVPALSAASNIKSGAGSGESEVVKRTKVDTSKGIRTLNMKRAQAGRWKRPAVRVKVKRR